MFFLMFKRGRKLALPTFEIEGLFLLLWGIFLYMSGLLGELEINALIKNPIFWFLPFLLGAFGYLLELLLIDDLLKRHEIFSGKLIRRFLWRLIFAFVVLLIISIASELGYIFQSLRVIRNLREIFLFVSSGLVCYLLAFVIGLPSLVHGMLKLPSGKEFYATVRLRFLYLNAALVSGGMVFLILLTFLFSKRSLEPEIERNLLNNVKSISSLADGIFQDFSRDPAFISLKRSQKEGKVISVLKERLNKSSSGKYTKPFVISSRGKILYLYGYSGDHGDVVDPVTGKTLTERVYTSQSGIFEFFWPQGGKGKRVVIRVSSYPKLSWILGVMVPWEFIMEPVLNFSERMFFLAGIFVISIIGVTFFTIKGPLSTLDAVMEKLRQEPMTTSSDIDEITKSLDDLLYKLKFQEKAVTEYAKRLSFLYREAMTLVNITKKDHFLEAFLLSGIRAFEGTYAFLLPNDPDEFNKKMVDVLFCEPIGSPKVIRIYPEESDFWRLLLKEDSPALFGHEVPLSVSQDLKISAPWKALSVPVTFTGEKEWVLLIVKEKEDFLKEDTLLLATLGSIASMVYERLSYEANLEVKVEERTEKLINLQKELEKANILLREQAIRDPLTGVFNRRYMNEIFESVPKAYEQSALVLLDLDGFKGVNDTYGHRVGDFTLKAAVRTIQNNLRVEDYVFRYGGDEFIIYLPGITEDGAYKVAERLRKALFFGKYLYRAKERQIELHISASFGVVVLSSSNADSLKKAIAVADRAMYRAKKAGKNRVEIVKLEGDC